MAEAGMRARLLTAHADKDDGGRDTDMSPL